MRRRGLTKQQKRLAHGLRAFCCEHNHEHAKKPKTVSKHYQHERFLRLDRRLVVDLHEVGRPVQKLTNLREGDIADILRHMERRGLSAGTMQNFVSSVRFLCDRLDRPHVLPPDPASLLEDPSRYRRTTCAERDKSASAAGVDLMGLIDTLTDLGIWEALPLRFGIWFGLRAREMCLLRPHESDKSDRLAVSRGAKNYRYREVPIVHAEQRALIDEAKTATKAASCSLMPQSFRARQAAHLLKRALVRHAGLTRAKAGAIVHGMRHDYAHRRYKELTGLPIPLVRTFSLTRDQILLDRWARLRVSEESGLERLYIGNRYLGAMTERAPKHCNPDYLRSLTPEAVAGLRANSDATLQSLFHADSFNAAGSRVRAPHSAAP